MSFLSRNQNQNRIFFSKNNIIFPKHLIYVILILSFLNRSSAKSPTIVNTSAYKEYTDYIYVYNCVEKVV